MSYFSTSPSSSSSSSSGRTTPESDPNPPPPPQPWIPSQRRSSTPQASFLPPNLCSIPFLKSMTGDQQPKSEESLEIASSSSSSSSPTSQNTNVGASSRRAGSFGSSFGSSASRFSALSSLGFNPLSHSTYTLYNNNSSKKLASAGGGGGAGGCYSSDTNELHSKIYPIASPAPPPPPPSSSTPSTSLPSTNQPTKASRKHMCFPDGMGGTMCVEVKDRPRRCS
ncbi:hypothetical protein IE53DRAFT_390293 [Violaceomyces palustris]|uniref:Uncharacterized protein n=1 Tax=Violaceomyces palustris TaxID=1673888 RepID=A0ACD0NP29_9BASI|nr:hypothetical protein IE53DRAFT_390293 [Violaceomyces palustris]